MAQLDHLTFVTVDMGESPEDTGQHWASKRFNILGVPQLKLVTPETNLDIKARTIVALIKEIND